MAKRLLDISLYTFISWVLMLYLYSSDPAKEKIKGLISFQQALSECSVFFWYLIVGLLTKHILINAGDRYDERIKIRNPIHLIENRSLEKLLSHLSANLPLKSTIFLFIGLVYFSSETKINIFNFPELLVYVMGLLSPKLNKFIELYCHLFKQKNNNSVALLNDYEWYQQEEPINTTTQDRLNRTELVSRMCDIIVNSKVKDSRGIALIASYGMGKSSTINMVIESITHHQDNYLICRVDAWGAYSSDEQIQKYIIERLIKSLSTVVSTTNLSGLPSKYISSLKGAQSLWLDALPLFDNYRSPVKQCDQINDILERIDHNMVFIIEDLDRNKDAAHIFNSIAPLIENLNGNGRIKVILSIGDALNDPVIINRICRYKEFLIFDKDHIYSHIQKSVTTLLKESDFPYHCSVSYFFKKSMFNNSIEDNVRHALFSYISTPRDLKILLTQFSYDWKKSLKGSCDILDLLAITILKNHEDNLIKALLLTNDTNTEFTKITSQLKNAEFKNIEAAQIIFNYFFKKNNFSISKKRLQSCSKNYNRYFLSIVNRAPTTSNSAVNERAYFEDLYHLIKICKTSSNENEILYYIKKILSYVDIDFFIHDFNSINKNNSAAPLIVLYCQYMTNGKSNGLISDEIIGKLPRLIDGLSMRNNSLLRKITKDATTVLMQQNLSLLSFLYTTIDTVKLNKTFVYTHDFNLIMSNFIVQGELDFKSQISYQILDLFINTYFVIMFEKDKQAQNDKGKKNYKLKIVSWLYNHNSELSSVMFTYIKKYKISSNHGQQVENIIISLQNEINIHMHELTSTEI
ncbi:KAP family NTPase [Aeromonas piscicola]|uniref:KAP family NTPase n=1 Tax=Aeromonas piscicola TaxID=600645 RepID=UPI0021F88456|nr:KAP family NTPase [Aeromonas piscicola]MCW0507548.1 KAP family NTPase [Aeromonas piscicola]